MLAPSGATSRSGRGTLMTWPPRIGMRRRRTRRSTRCPAVPAADERAAVDWETFWHASQQEERHMTMMCLIATRRRASTT